MPTGRRRIPLRLQDVIAAILAVAFAALCVWTWNHLCISLNKIHKETHEARAKLDAWAQRAGPGHATQIEADVADSERKRNKSLDAIEALERDVHAAQADASQRELHLHTVTTNPGEDGITYNGRWFTPGPKPEPLVHEAVSPAVTTWNAKDKVAHQLNVGVSAAREATEEAHARVQNAAKSLGMEKDRLAQIVRELARLRDLKNSIMARADDPREMDRLRDVVASVDTRNLFAVAVHAPFLVITLLYAITSVFRLLVLREALGSKRVTHAD
jgi:hypothetical protein